jgi:hypothetical protein
VGGGLLGGIDDLPPDEHGRLWGVSAAFAVPGRGAITATWQRVIREDGAALYSDRAALDGSTRLAGVTLDASLAWDLSEQEVNEARLRASRQLPWGLSASAEARRHRPFFEAWTIWGVFSPVAFDGLAARWNGAAPTVDWASPCAARGGSTGNRGGLLGHAASRRRLARRRGRRLGPRRALALVRGLRHRYRVRRLAQHWRRRPLDA